jgi:hypothetical protein
MAQAGGRHDVFFFDHDEGGDRSLAKGAEARAAERRVLELDVLLALLPVPLVRHARSGQARDRCRSEEQLRVPVVACAYAGLKDDAHTIDAGRRAIALDANNAQHR